MLNEDYTQPFYVPINKRHLFRGVNASGYLPPLEPPQEKPEVVREYTITRNIVVDPRILKHTNTMRRALRHEQRISNLEGEQVFMRNKLNELSQRKTKRGRYLE